jgi:hypothetical protein
MENVTFCESGPSRRQEEINLTALIRGLSFAERALEKDPEWIFLGRNQSGRMAGWCRRMKNEKEEIVALYFPREGRATTVRRFAHGSLFQERSIYLRAALARCRTERLN